MSCAIYYDFVNHGYGQWNFMVLSLSMGVLGTLLYAVGASMRTTNFRLASHYLRLAGIAFAVGWPAVGIYKGVGSYLAYQELLELRSKGEEKMIMGKVSNFSPFSRRRKIREESFSIDGRRFSYSPDELRPGFRQTRVDGSPIRDGLTLRVNYIGEVITRLEICSSGK